MISRSQMNRQLYQMGGEGMQAGMQCKGIMQMAPQEMQQMDAEQYRPVAEQLAQDPNQALMAIVRMLMEQGIPEEEAIKIAKQMIQAVAEGGIEEVSDDTRVEARFGGRIGYAEGGISRLVAIENNMD
jgi:membrane protease subunit (stomatin/prohibitin family)